MVAFAAILAGDHEERNSDTKQKVIEKLKRKLSLSAKNNKRWTNYAIKFIGVETYNVLVTMHVKRSTFMRKTAEQLL
jgi:mRNA deadenylase 3'-5' endonuclease subunit Ccr4